MSPVAAKGEKIPALDGLRGLSISLVLLAHLSGTRDLATGVRLYDLDSLGNLGVRIFFVISGFLITLLLLQERSVTGHISLPRFYLRRGLRIFPAAYLYMGILFVCAALGFVVLAPGDRLHALTYTVNYHHLRSWQVSHLWSLSVEEQFYLVWPALLLVFGARGGLWLAFALVVAAPLVRMGIWSYWPERRIEIGEAFSTIGDAIATGCLLAGMRARLGQSERYLRCLRSPWFVVVPLLVVAAPLVRMGIWIYWPARRIEIGEAFSTIGDAIATGCLLAGMRARLGQSERYLRCLRSPWFVVVPLLVAVANAFQHYPAIDFLAGQTIMNVAIALTIDRCVRVDGDWVRRLLESRPLALLGTLSYSLYLWQEPFLNRFSRSEVTQFPFNLLLAFAAASASHYLVERPLLRWRQRLRRA